MTKLSSKQIFAARPENGRAFLRLYDGNGLFVQISKTGRKFWRLKYKRGNKETILSLGEFPQISLEEARELAANARIDIAKGNKPKKKKTSSRKKTFEQITLEYLENRQDLSAGYRIDMENALKNHVLPFCGSIPIQQLERADLVKVLMRVNARGSFSLVRKLRIWCAMVFDFAIELGEIEHNHAREIRPHRLFGRCDVTHFAALELEELPDFFYALSLENDFLIAVRMLKMLAYTWGRTKEVRGMRWDEIDLKRGVWTIPRERMKSRRAHVVTLPRQAVALLHALKAANRGGVFVFESNRNPDRTLSENAVLALIARLGYRGRMTGHGFRSIASTWANKNGFNPDVIELALAHVPENQTRAAYNRNDYKEERAAMLQAYADFLDSVGMNG